MPQRVCPRIGVKITCCELLELHALYVVTPAHRSGAASADSSSSGIDATASVLSVAYSAYPPSRLMPFLPVGDTK